MSFKSWSKKSNTMNSCRVWVKELGLSKFKRFVAWVRKYTSKSKCQCVERSPRLIGLKNLINGYRSM